MKKSVPLAFCWYPFGVSIVQLASWARETAAPGPEIVSARSHQVGEVRHSQDLMSAARAAGLAPARLEGRALRTLGVLARQIAADG